MFLTETPIPGSEPKNGALPKVRLRRPFPPGSSPRLWRWPRCPRCVHVDVHRGQRAVEAARLTDREHEDPAVGTHQVIAGVIVGGHDPHDVRDLDPEAGQGPEEARDWPTGKTNTPPSEPTRL